MPYYKTTKNSFIKFYQEYVSQNAVLPHHQISQDEYDIIAEFIKNNTSDPSKTFREDDTASNLTHVLRAFTQYCKDNKEFASLLQSEDKTAERLFLEKLYDKPLDKIGFYEYTTTPSTKEFIEFLSAVRKYIPTFPYKDNEDDDRLSQLYIMGSFPNLEKYENFYQVVNFVENKTQSMIIPVNFGDSQSIPLDPIMDIDGLSQGYALPYMDIDKVIFETNSDLSQIQDLLDNVSPATMEEVSQISSAFSYRLVDLGSLILKPDNTPDNIIQETSTLENLSSKKEVLTIKDSFQILANEILSDKTILEHSLKASVDALLEKTKENPQEAEEAYIDTIHQIFEQLYSGNKKALSALQLFSPTNLTLGFLFNKEFGEAHHEKLLTKLNIVEASFLYMVATDYTSKIHKNSKITDNLLSNGSNYSFSHYASENSPEQELLRQLVSKISEKDPDIHTMFDKSPLFVHLQQDIYPLLKINDKLNYLNHKCFETPISKLNRLKHVDSVPMPLIENDKIAQNIFSQFEGLSYSDKEHFDKYVANLSYYKFVNFLETQSLNENFVDISFQLPIQSNHSIYNNFYNLLTDDNKIDDIVKLAILNINKTNKEYSNLKNITQKIVLTEISSSNHNLSLETLYDVMRTFKSEEFIRGSSSLANKLCARPEFDMQESKNQNLIFDLFSKYYYCLNKDSHPKFKAFARTPEFIQRVITKEKNAGLKFSDSNSFNIQDGFGGETILTASSVKKLSHLGLDIMHASPSLLSVLPPEVLLDKEAWKKKIISLTNSQESYLPYEINRYIPQDIFEDINFFKELYDIKLNPSPFNDDKNHASSFLRDFSKLYYLKTDSITMLLNSLANKYEKRDYEEVSKNIYYAEHYSFKLHQNLLQLFDDSKKQNTNLFKQALIALEEDILRKQNPLPSTAPTKSIKF